MKTKSTVFCDKNRKTRCFYNRFKNITTTQGLSRSMVPVGLGGRSNSTRLMPGSWEVPQLPINAKYLLWFPVRPVWDSIQYAPPLFRHRIFVQTAFRRRFFPYRILAERSWTARVLHATHRNDDYSEGIHRCSNRPGR